MLCLNLIGVPKELSTGLSEVLPALNISLSADGIPVKVTSSDCLKAYLSADSGRIEYAEKIQFFRALSHLSREGIGCDVTERQVFTTNGAMIDVSRNAVLTVEAVKLLLRKMALMGLNMLMLYTEDTYEVEGYPYFGYMRGGYIKAQIRELDDYAYDLGIEMIPCIQTLGHSSMILRWYKAMNEIADTSDVLLADDEKTYAYLRQIIKDASEPYRSKRIHIGMDEAGGLGSGAYRDKHGDVPKIEIFQKHIVKVNEICSALDLKPMIWSDMYFTLLTPSHDYEPDFDLPDHVVEMIPKEVSLIYWDYYRHDKAQYDKLIRQHQRSKSNLWFAGGLWNWNSPAVNYDYVISTSVPGLTACKDNGVKEVFATVWNDGNEGQLLNILYGLQLYAEFDYTGKYDPDTLGRRFEALHHADPQAFLDLSLFDMVPKAKHLQPLAPDPARYLLAEDPLTLLFEKDLEGCFWTDHYRHLQQTYRRYKEQATDEYRLLWQYYELLAEILSKKCDWREHIPTIVRSKDRTAAKPYAVMMEELAVRTEELRSLWYALWHSAYNCYGWDIIDLRIGGLIARMKTAAGKMHDFADGKVETVPEIETEKLPYASCISPLHSNFIGYPGHFGSWRASVSPSFAGY